jgi:formamidopyrimidine-DNA glycosylase
MPELPEVETIRRDLCKMIVDKKITGVKLSKTKVVRGNASQIKKLLVGNHFVQIERVGKLLMFLLHSGEYLFVHLKMTGQLFYVREKVVAARGGHSLSKEIDNTLPNKHTHLVLDFSGGGRMFFNDMRRFAYLQVVNQKQKQIIVETYGIEPLTKNFTFDKFVKVFKNRKTNLKAVLLNQKLIAGIGNIYADEICFAAGVRPSRSVAKLTKEELNKLFLASEEIIGRAVKARGTTFNSYVDGSGKKGSFLRQLQVYSRGKMPCLVCGTKLTKIRLAGRGTVFCEKCQK